MFLRGKDGDDAFVIRILCEADLQLIREPVNASNPESDHHLSLPLHFAARYAGMKECYGYDIILYLLHLYPEAANIKKHHII